MHTKKRIEPRYVVVVKVDGHRNGESTCPMSLAAAKKYLQDVADNFLYSFREQGKTLLRKCSFAGAEIPGYLKQICPFANFVHIQRLADGKRKMLVTYEINITYNY